MNSHRDGLARSVQTRLARHAKGINTDPNLVLTRYAVERFLYRLSRSPHVDRFVLKGALLSRMKDYFDLHALSREDGANVSQVDAAIAATFERRKTPLPDAWPLGLSDEFAHDAAKVAQWQAFLTKNRLDAPTLAEVIDEVRQFLVEPIRLARQRQETP